MCDICTIVQHFSFKKKEKRNDSPKIKLQDPTQVNEGDLMLFLRDEPVSQCQ